jgi:hypothetical protein
LVRAHRSVHVRADHRYATLLAPTSRSCLTNRLRIVTIC